MLYWNGSAWSPTSILMALSGGITLTGTLNANGGTGTSGQILEINGSGLPVWATVSGTGSVTSVDVSGGTTGLTTSGGPIQASGTITLAGTLTIPHGGTGAITASGAINNLLPSQSGKNGLVLMSDGMNVGWASVSGTGTVTSVGLSSPSEFNVINSPITGAGVLTLTKSNEAANTVWAGPTAGSSDAPAFRKLVSADIPDNAANTSGNAATATFATTAENATTAGSATNFTGTLAGDVTGSQGATVVSSVGGSSAASVHSAEQAANNATNTNTASAIVKRDASGNFSAGTITAELNGNAATATSATTAGTATNFSGTLAGDVTGSQSATVVSSVGGSSAASVHSAEQAANNATNTNSASAIVKRDASGNFSAGTITANLTGNVSGTASNVTGTVAIANGGTGGITASDAINNLLPSQSGNAGKVLETNGSTASWQTVSGSGSVTSVGLSVPSEWTVTNSPITSSGTITIAKANESANTVFAGPSSGGDALPTFRSLVSADIPDNASNTSGNAATATFATTAGTATSAGTATNFSGLLSGDVTGSQSATVVSSIGGSSATDVHSAEVAANAATNANTASAIVKRDASGNFSAGTITANLNGTATTATSATTAGTATSAGTATNFSGMLSGEVTGSQSATVVSSVGGSSATNIHSAEVAANAATNANTALAIVKRDASGNFSAGTITANLTGNISGTASNVTGTVATNNGGTGLTGYTTGDLLYAASASTLAKLSVGSNPDGYVLTLSGGLPAWQAASGGGGSGWTLTGNSLAGTEVLGSTNAQPLVIETNGSERLRVLSGGNIGIGTSSPGQLLEVKNGNLLLSNSGTARALQFQGTGSGVSTFSAGAQGSTTINYTLPTSQGASNSVLANDGSGNLSWTPSSSTIFKRKTNQQDYTTTSLVSDTNLYVSLNTNATYTFTCFLSFSDPEYSGNSVKIGFTSPTGSTLKYGINDASAGFGGSRSVINGSGTVSTTISIDNTSTSETCVLVTGIVITSSSSGTLQFKCEETSTPGYIRLNTNSFLQVTQVQ